MGARWRKRLGDLGSEEDDIEVRSTTKQRAMASAQAFLSGYLGNENNPTETDLNIPEPEDYPHIEKDNELLRFYDNCAKYQDEVKNNKKTYKERETFLKSEHFSNLAERVANKTGVPLSISDISLVWQICR